MKRNDVEYYAKSFPLFFDCQEKKKEIFFSSISKAIVKRYIDPEGRASREGGGGRGGVWRFASQNKARREGRRQ